MVVTRQGIGPYSWLDLLVLFFIGGAFGAILSGCGPKNHKPPPAPDPYAVRDGDYVFYWFLPTMSTPALPASIDPQRQALNIAAFHYQVAAFEAEVGPVYPVFVTRFYLDAGTVPCGAPNGGGCYTAGTSPPTMWLTSGPWNTAPHAYHELFHSYLSLTTGKVDPTHSDPRWPKVIQRDLDLISEIIARRP